MAKISLRHVADRSGVSISTVARVVNAHPAIHPDTAAKVQAAIAELGYQAKPFEKRQGPRGARGQVTHNVALLLVGMDPALVRRLSAPGPLAMILNEHRLRLVYVPMPDPAVLPDIIDLRRIDGVIIQGLQPVGAADAALRKIPTVWMMTRRSPTWWSDWVEPDNAGYGALALEHFRQRGHQRIALLDSQPGYPAFAQRRQGFLAAAAHAGIAVVELADQRWLTDDLFHPVVDEQRVIAQIDRFLALPERPRALLAMNGAVLVHRQLKRRGITPRQDLDLLACELDPDVAEALDPVPDRIDISIQDIAARTVEQLLRRMAHPTAPGPVGASLPALLFPVTPPA